MPPRQCTIIRKIKIIFLKNLHRGVFWASGSGIMRNLFSGERGIGGPHRSLVWQALLANSHHHLLAIMACTLDLKHITRAAYCDTSLTRGGAGPRMKKKPMQACHFTSRDTTSLSSLCVAGSRSWLQSLPRSMSLRDNFPCSNRSLLSQPPRSQT